MSYSHLQLLLVASLSSCSGGLVACSAGNDGSLAEELDSHSESVGVRPVDPTALPSPAVPLSDAPPPGDSPVQRAKARSWGVDKVKWLFDVECGQAGIWPARYNECCYEYPTGWGVGGPGQTKCDAFCKRLFFTESEIQACNDGCLSELTRVCQANSGG